MKAKSHRPSLCVWASSARGSPDPQRHVPGSAWSLGIPARRLRQTRSNDAAQFAPVGFSAGVLTHPQSGAAGTRTRRKVPWVMCALRRPRGLSVFAARPWCDAWAPSARTVACACPATVLLSKPRLDIISSQALLRELDQALEALAQATSATNIIACGQHRPDHAAA